MSVDINQGSPVLKFNMVLVMTSESGLRGGARGVRPVVEVWEIGLAGDGMGLEATRLTRFSVEPIGPCYAISIRGDMLAMRMLLTEKLILHIADISPLLTFLPDIPITTNIPDNTQISPISYSSKESVRQLMAYSLLNPVLYGNTVRFALFAGMTHIYGLIVELPPPEGPITSPSPHTDGDQDPHFKFVRFAKLPTKEEVVGKISLSYNNLVFETRRGGVHLVRFKWPDDPGADNHLDSCNAAGIVDLAASTPLSSLGKVGAHLDMGSGRVVSLQGNEIVMVELGSKL
ncbi:hypothetical protein BDN72DRAFT_898220 [Pluteus cervinus]|uniref:Uncharacterized protein n=1 Tax=Pluteus cervinus TaxID=181527 RepID=A0ACD3AQY4_9AGAR|nr:hypothetical protein BDN72DRAFT_898220 [Pluteus cervinus]